MYIYLFIYFCTCILYIPREPSLRTQLVSIVYHMPHKLSSTSNVEAATSLANTISLTGSPFTFQIPLCFIDLHLIILLNFVFICVLYSLF
jgi:hypothetical protein